MVHRTAHTLMHRLITYCFKIKLHLDQTSSHSITFFQRNIIALRTVWFLISHSTLPLLQFVFIACVQLMSARYWLCLPYVLPSQFRIFAFAYRNYSEGCFLVSMWTVLYGMNLCDEKKKILWVCVKSNSYKWIPVK